MQGTTSVPLPFLSSWFHLSNAQHISVHHLLSCRSQCPTWAGNPQMFLWGPLPQQDKQNVQPEKQLEHTLIHCLVEHNQVIYHSVVKWVIRHHFPHNSTVQQRTSYRRFACTASLMGSSVLVSRGALAHKLIIVMLVSANSHLTSLTLVLLLTCFICMNFTISYAVGMSSRKASN